MTEAPALRGIVLAGGKGTRLYPVTLTSSKHLLAVFDKPMVYYPLTTLMMAGVSEILIISTPEDLPRYQKLLGTGELWGMCFEYAEQATAAGIAEALLIGEEFTGSRSVMLTLGDNVFYGRFDFLRKAVAGHGDHATIFAYHVDDPSSYGVVEFDGSGQALGLEEKPDSPKSNWAVPGLYLYPPDAAEEVRRLTPSGRGELEITDLNRRYLESDRLRVVRMGRGVAWFDTGTATDLLEAANFIQAVQHRQGLIVGCPEEVAYRMGLIDLGMLDRLVATLPDGGYRSYLERVVVETA